MRKSTYSSRISIVAIVALFVCYGPLAAQEAREIGSVAAVNRDIVGTPPDSPDRALLLGDRLIANERLVSSPLGSGQMLFLDQTSLTVAPNSQIVLDKYVYDPDVEVGEIGVTISRGLLRVIGGRITKTSDAIIRTPTATIGVRGGIALVSIEDENTTRVMHVAGEYTRIQTDEGTLTLSRPNAFATATLNGVEFNGVASEEEIAELYNQMQGGGGGTDEPIDKAAVEGSGVAALGSEDPNAVEAQPISTSGESAEADGTAETEQLNLATDPDIQIEVTDDIDEGGRFANFVGGALLVSPNDQFVDDDGSIVDDPVSQNFLFAAEGVDFISIREGSIIGVLPDGGVVRSPLPDESGFFNIDPVETGSPFGQFGGRGFADLESGVILNYISNQDGQIGATLFAQPGPTQLRDLNVGNSDFRITPFRVLPDLHAADGASAVPFLPDGLGDVFDNGAQTDIFLISQPNSTVFAPGTTGFIGDESRLTQTLLPLFRLEGEGADQTFLLAVGAQQVVNDGTDTPSIALFSRGSMSLDASRPASRLQLSVSATSISSPDGDVKILGANDDYLLLGNETEFGFSNTNPEEATFVSFIQNINDFSFEPYGNLNLAQRQEAENIAPGARFLPGFGTGPAAYAAETGRNGLDGFLGEDDVRLLSFAYSSSAGTLRNGFGDVSKFAIRTDGATDGGAAGFSLNSGRASVALRMEETLRPAGIDGDDVGAVEGALLVFGDGSRSGAIDQNRYGMREAFNPAAFENTLLNIGETSNQVLTNDGPLPVRQPTQFGTESSARLALLSHGFADSAAIFPDGVELTPQYLTWGWWTGQYRAAFDENVIDDPKNGARVQFHLGTFVAGNRTDVLPASGAASFNGPVIVNSVDANGVDFVDGGRFSMTWDFGANSGDAGFQDVLDLPNFLVPVSEAGRIGVNDYGGVRTVGGSDVRVDGSFFDGLNPNDALATAGTLRIDDVQGGRVATGTFWGER